MRDRLAFRCAKRKKNAQKNKRATAGLYGFIGVFTRSSDEREKNGRHERKTQKKTNQQLCGLCDGRDDFRQLSNVGEKFSFFLRIRLDFLFFFCFVFFFAARWISPGRRRRSIGVSRRRFPRLVLIGQRIDRVTQGRDVANRRPRPLPPIPIEDRQGCGVVRNSAMMLAVSVPHFRKR